VVVVGVVILIINFLRHSVVPRAVHVLVVYLKRLVVHLLTQPQVGKDTQRRVVRAGLAVVGVLAQLQLE
jgi:hypothetical protein